MNSTNFIEKLKTYQSDKEYEKIRRYFKADDKDNQVIGVRMKKIFDLAKENTNMPLSEVEKLLESPFYESRMGAVSILDFKARPKQITEKQHQALFDLYINRHERINNWDFVDRAAKRVVGKYLYEFDKPYDVLYDLAASENVWESRTAIVSTSWFIKKGELDDTFHIAEILLKDNHESSQKAVGSWLRHAGKKEEQKLLDFLEKHAANMHRATLRIATEKLENDQRMYFRKKK